VLFANVSIASSDGKLEHLTLKRVRSPSKRPPSQRLTEVVARLTEEAAHEPDQTDSRPMKKLQLDEPQVRSIFKFTTRTIELPRYSSISSL
jgi:hypothetical protein